MKKQIHHQDLVKAHEEFSLSKIQEVPLDSKEEIVQGIGKLLIQ